MGLDPKGTSCLGIEIKKLKKHVKERLNIKGGVVLDGLPGSGCLVNAIASECLIRTTGTELVGYLDSPDFAPISVVSNFVPQYPVRIYVNENLKVAFFVSEVNIERPIQKEVAKTIIEWTVENDCKLIISAQGISSSATPVVGELEKSGISDDSEENGVNDTVENTTNNKTQFVPHTDIYAVSSNLSAARLVVGHGSYFKLLRSGTVSGIPAILLNEGALMNLDVIVFLVNVLTNNPDFRAAAMVSEAISRIIPNLSCDIGALMVEAQTIENRIKTVTAEQKRLSYIT
jgi:uncharacterized protein